MLFFPNSKINLGLNVVEKRSDGFHNIESVFYPLGWTDALEVIENKNDKETILMSHSGLPIAGNLNENLVYRAWQKVSEVKKLPPLKIHLHKAIPMGAGLGGGSADAAFLIHLLDKKFSLSLSSQVKKQMAASLGSDCAFFIENEPVLATGKGDEFSEINVDLGSYYILVVYPGIHCDTKEAYALIKPQLPQYNLRQVIQEMPLKKWKDFLKNDFEEPIFNKYPQIKALKHNLYDQGALFASMSGSGSAVFGIFDREPEITLPAGHQFFLQNPVSNVL